MPLTDLPTRAADAPETTVMVFGPRDADELDVVRSLVRESYRYAGGRIRE